MININGPEKLPLGLAFDVSIPVFDDDGATFVEQKQIVVYRKINQKWTEAINELRDYFDKLYELQIGTY